MIPTCCLAVYDSVLDNAVADTTSKKLQLSFSKTTTTTSTAAAAATTTTAETTTTKPLKSTISFGLWFS